MSFLKNLFNKETTEKQPIRLHISPERAAPAEPQPTPEPQPEPTPQPQPASHIQYEKVSCLYCGSTDAATYRNRADIVKCNTCGLVYLRTRPTMESLYQIYQTYATSGHMRLPDSIAEIKNNPLRREWFVNETMTYCNKKTGLWLDVGCGWAALLMYARECGFTPIGIEVTRSCIDYAVMQLQIPVSNNQFTDSKVGENSCEVISMVHVFEHIPNPKETLAKIYKTLVPGGLFCGIVPNIGSYCSDQQKEGWVWLDETHHYVHYEPATLKQKLEEAGFIVEKLYTSVGDYTEYFYDVLKKDHPSKSDAELEQIRKELEQNGKGDEIRFYARRPN